MTDIVKWGDEIGSLVNCKRGIQPSLKLLKYSGGILSPKQG